MCSLDGRVAGLLHSPSEEDLVKPLGKKKDVFEIVPTVRTVGSRNQSPPLEKKTIYKNFYVLK
jgi:hypothetical protein